MRKNKYFGIRLNELIFVSALVCRLTFFYALHYRKLDFAPQERSILSIFRRVFPWFSFMPVPRRVQSFYELHYCKANIKRGEKRDDGVKSEPSVLWGYYKKNERCGLNLRSSSSGKNLNVSERKKFQK